MSAEKTVVTRFKAIDEQSTVANKIRRGYAAMRGDIKGFGNDYAKLMTVGVAAVTAIGLASINNADALLKERIAFNRYLKDTKKGGEIVGTITDISDRFNVQRDVLADSAKQLLAVGYTTKEVKSQFGSLGEIVAYAGTDQFPTLIDILTKTKTTGKATGREIKTLALMGIPIKEQLAKNFGIGVDKVMQYADKGKIKFKDFKAALDTVSKNQFKGTQAQNDRTYSGLIDGFDDFKTKLLRKVAGMTDQGDIVSGGLFDTAQKQLGALSKWVDDNGPAIEQFAQKGGKMLGDGLLSAGTGIVKIADGVSKLNPEDVKLFAEVVAVMGSGAAVASFASSLNPVGILVGELAVSIAALAGSYGKLKELINISAETAKIEAAINNIKSKTQKSIDELNQKAGIARMTNPGSLLGGKDPGAQYAAEAAKIKANTLGGKLMAGIQIPTAQTVKKDVKMQSTTTVNVNGSVFGITDLKGIMRQTIQEEQDKQNKLSILSLQ